MSLDIYLEKKESGKVTESNQHSVEHDGLNGSWETQKLWIRNSSPSYYYEDVKIILDIPDAPVKPNVSPKGIIYQLVEGDIEPTVLEWKSLPYHNDIDIGDIGSSDSADTSTYYPFWLRTYVPGATAVGRIQEASLKIEAIQNAI